MISRLGHYAVSLSFVCNHSSVSHILTPTSPPHPNIPCVCVCGLHSCYHNNQDCPCHGLCSLWDIYVKAAADHLARALKPSGREGGWPIFKITGIQTVSHISMILLWCYKLSLSHPNCVKWVATGLITREELLYIGLEEVVHCLHIELALQ